jgi:hypothetical protein
MLNSGPNLAAPLDGPPPFGQVASPAGRSHFEQLPARLLRLPDPRTVDAGVTHVGTTFRAARIAGTRIRIRPRPKLGTVAGGENPFPPIYQVANEMTETQRQAGAQRRRP